MRERILIALEKRMTLYELHRELGVKRLEILKHLLPLVNDGKVIRTTEINGFNYKTKITTKSK